MKSNVITTTTTTNDNEKKYDCQYGDSSSSVEELNKYNHKIHYYPSLLGVCASSNPPSVLYEISLSGQPEPVQVHVTLFGLAPLRSSVSF